MSKGEFISDLTQRLIPDSFQLGISDQSILETRYDFSNVQDTEETNSEIFQESIDTDFSNNNSFGKDGSIERQNAEADSGVASNTNELGAISGDSLSILPNSESGIGDDRGNSSFQSTQESFEAEAVGELEGFQDLLTSSNFTNFAGLGLGMLNSGFMDYLSNNQTAQTMANQTQGRIHLAPQLTAAQQESTMRLTSTIANLEIGVGSFFGPVGLAVGSVAGIATDAIGSYIAQNQVADINSTSGNLVSDIQ